MLEHEDNRVEGQVDLDFDGHIKGLQEGNERLVDVSLEELPILKEEIERHVKGLERIIKEQERQAGMGEE